ncbi:MAG: hypothetical protein LBF79_02285, partial [Dysgonamonadaceae bacterium]|nr:hypothetical protein [Dysgonamonadaceae bacterium]
SPPPPYGHPRRAGDSHAGEPDRRGLRSSPPLAGVPVGRGWTSFYQHTVPNGTLLYFHSVG